MKRTTQFVLLFALSLSPELAVAQGSAAAAAVSSSIAAPAAQPAQTVRSARVRYDRELELLIFEQQLAADPLGTVVTARGAVDRAPVLGWVFPTTLPPSAVGFRTDGGILALAVTLHPDFDDTPLWDESGNWVYDDDGGTLHPHWVVLEKNETVSGGLAVRGIEANEIDSKLPPTNPGMPLFLDSPGFSVTTDGATLRVLVPVTRVSGKTDFRFDAVSAYMEVNTSDSARPMLGVYEVYQVLSGDLSLPFTVEAR